MRPSSVSWLCVCVVVAVVEAWGCICGVGGGLCLFCFVGGWVGASGCSRLGWMWRLFGLVA